MTPERSSRSEARPLRLFVAVDLASEGEDILERALAPWHDRLPQARWVARRKWHVTLKFLGRTDPGLLERVTESCRGVAASAAAFEISLSGLGVFPGRSRARVLWAGLDDPAGGLAALAAALDEALAGDFPPETRAFTPHMTVARFNPPVPFAEHAEALDRTELRTDPFAVERLILYRSRLSPKGAEYEALQTFPLGG